MTTTPLIAADETTFARRVYTAAVPVIAVFHSVECDACRALLPSAGRLAGQYAGQLVTLSVNVDQAPFLAEQCGVAAVPTLLVLNQGDELTRAVGFAPEQLLRLLFEQAAAGELPPGPRWSPTEQVFEDAIIIPLLDAWGWTYQRQVACLLPSGRSAARGRVDILVYADDPASPFTLFENKRQIASGAALQQATAQARRYARAFQLTSFVVAAPAGMWIYRLGGAHARLTQSFTSLEIAAHPEIVRQALRWIH